jgi:beta-carotene 3-hydroxylase
VIIPALLAGAAFVAMEGVSYGLHRWVMHGPGMAWHRSHHLPPAGRFERNDRFPACFSVLGFALFALGAWAPGLGSCTWVGLGVTAYGFVYLVVHEVHIHHRLPVALPHARYLDWVREAHAAHHRTSGEPYGMLLPLLRGTSRASSRPTDAVLDRRVDPARPTSTRVARSRL